MWPIAMTLVPGIAHLGQTLQIGEQLRPIEQGFDDDQVGRRCIPVESGGSLHPAHLHGDVRLGEAPILGRPSE